MIPTRRVRVGAWVQIPATIGDIHAKLRPESRVSDTLPFSQPPDLLWWPVSLVLHGSARVMLFVARLESSAYSTAARAPAVAWMAFVATLPERAAT